MKKALLSFILMGVVLSSGPIHAVSAVRTVKCSLSRFHRRFKCTEEEKVAGKKWLQNVSISAAAGAIATALAVIGITVGAQEIKKEKQKIAQEHKKQPAQAVCSEIVIRDAATIKELGLNPNKECFAWYEVLGFSAPVSQGEAKKRYFMLSRKYHPDKHGDDPFYHNVYREISAAYDLVK